MIVDSRIPKGGRILRQGQVARSCPWCWRNPLAFRAFARSVRFTCAGRCGYEATISLQYVAPDEKKEIFPDE